MVYAESNISLADGQLYFSCKHSLRVGSRCPLPSPVGDFEAMTDKEPCTSGAEENSQTQFEERCAFGSNLDANKKDSRGSSGLACSAYLSANSDKGPCCLSDMETDLGKWHKSNDDLDARKFKRARQDNCCSGSTPQPRDGEPGRIADKLLGREAMVCSIKTVGETIVSSGLDTGGVSGFGVSGVSNSSVSTSMSPDESNDIGFSLSELPAEIPFPPHFIERGLVPNESDAGECVLLPFYDKYCRKPPSVGSNHQVDVPPMNFNNAKINDKFVGTCIIPMPDTDTFSPSGIQLGNGCCPDQGSIRCVKQHVTEARELAKIAFGLEKFAQLGFIDMGEEVAKKWAAEEEQLFREVVFANPAPQKNFWNILPRYFRSRNSKELVSYYFNVFMLRKRGEQNRVDPRNADSDNDEWQDGDDCIMDGARKCPYGSIIYQDSAYVPDHEEDQEGSSDGDDEKETCDDFDVASRSTEQGPFNVCNGCVNKYNEDDSDKETYEHFAACSECNESSYCDSPKQSIIAYKSGFIPSELTMRLISEDMDENENSHSLFEGHHRGVYSSSEHTSVRTSTDAENGDLSLCKSMEERKGSFNVATTDHGYLSGPCGSQTWDVGYLTGSGEVVEFLPTCYVIEEVFGKGNCDNDATKDGPNII